MHILWSLHLGSGRSHFPKAMALVDGVTLGVVSREGSETWTAEEIYPAKLYLVPDPIEVESDNLMMTKLLRIRSQIGNFVRLVRIVGIEQPDLVHIWLDTRLESILQSLWPRNYRLVRHVHDVEPHDPSKRTRISRLLARWIWNRSDQLTVFNDSVKKSLVDEYKMDDAKIDVIDLYPVALYSTPAKCSPPAVNASGEGDGDGFPTQTGDRPLHVLLFGSLRLFKGLDTLLDALSYIPPGTPVTVRVAGAPSPEITQEMLDCLSTSPLIEMELGFIDESRKGELFSAADVILLPYRDFRSESGVLHEAMTNRIPMIVSDIPPFLPYIEKGFALPVKTNDPRSLAAGITRLAVERSLLGNLASAFPVNSYSETVDAYVSHLFTVYQDMARSD